MGYWRDDGVYIFTGGEKEPGSKEILVEVRRVVEYVVGVAVLAYSPRDAVRAVNHLIESGSVQPIKDGVIEDDNVAQRVQAESSGRHIGVKITHRDHAHWVFAERVRDSGLDAPDGGVRDD